MTSPLRITAAEYQAGALKQKRGNKFHAKRVKLDGYTFDSQIESQHYAQKRQQEVGGLISDLRVHPAYPLDVNGIRIAVYEADLAWREAGRLVVQETKGFYTPDAKLKVALFKALYPDIDYRFIDTRKQETKKFNLAYLKKRGLA